MSSIYDRLTELDISLPPLAIPAGAYVPFVRTGNLVFLSGHIAKRDGKAWVGQLGRDMTTVDRQEGGARRRDRPARHAACRGRRPRQGRAHRPHHEPGQQHPRLHRAPPGDQRLLRAVRRGLRRQGRARAQRLRRRPAAARRLRRDRADRPGRRRRMSAARRGRPTFGPLAQRSARRSAVRRSVAARRRSPRSPRALVSQHVFGMEPCPWCVLQRLIFVAIGVVRPARPGLAQRRPAPASPARLALLLAAGRPRGGALAALRRRAVGLVQPDARRPDRQRHRPQRPAARRVRGARQLRRRGGRRCSACPTTFWSAALFVALARS